jgi:hypothetical protein
MKNVTDLKIYEILGALICILEPFSRSSPILTIFKKMTVENRETIAGRVAYRQN